VAWTKHGIILILQNFLHVLITLFYKVKHNAMGEWRYGSVFFTLALNEGMCSVLYSGCFTPGERTTSADRIAEWVGPRASVGMVLTRNIPPCSGNWILVIQHIACWRLWVINRESEEE
jgi:hypothetical protein